jgi:uncharacterized membrane protein
METDEEYATVVLKRLDGPLPGTSTVDIGQAMTEGRRRRRVRRLTGLLSAGTATAVILVAVPVAASALRPGGPPAIGAVDGSGLPTGTASVVAPPPAPAACTIAKLPVPKGEMSLVTGGDPTGRYLVGQSYPDDNGYPQLLMWHDGSVRQLYTAGDDKVLNDVNSTGDAVGFSNLDGKSYAFAYVNGQMSPLSADPSQAYAINARGNIAGVVNGRATGWRSPLGDPFPLRTPPGDWQGAAYGVDDDGTMVGTLRSNGIEQAYMWAPDGAVHQLPVPEIDGGPATASRAFRVYAGWATGMAARGVSKVGAPAPVGATAAVRWNLRTGEVQVIPGLDGPVEGVNAYGWIAGGDAKGRAVLVSDAGVLPLPSLATPLHAQDSYASTVSDDGRTIAGRSVLDDKNRTVRAVVWHCR